MSASSVARVSIAARICAAESCASLMMRAFSASESARAALTRSRFGLCVYTGVLRLGKLLADLLDAASEVLRCWGLGELDHQEDDDEERECASRAPL
ncbi:MAG: hypothetical protein R2735_00765 [Microthrixaceae bacterium]